MMKTRLGLFVGALLCLPFIGLLLTDGQWNELQAFTLTATPLLAIALTGLLLLIYTALVHLWLTQRTGNNLFKLQRNYFLTSALASLVLNWLLVYLNHYSASWMGQGEWSLLGIALTSFLFATLLPAALITRALLGSFAWVLKKLTRKFALPALAPTSSALLLIPAALLGLLGSSAWATQLFWLTWAAPLLLLLALQLLWHESTIFAGLNAGDWSRVVCAALSGLLVGNLAYGVFQLTGGNLLTLLPHTLFNQLGFILYGLLSLQLGDVIAEFWRGKTRTLPSRKKNFPIPVVVK